MATVRLILDKELHKDGTALVRLILSDGRKVCRISTGFSVMPFQWNIERGKVVNHPNADHLNLELQKKLAEAQLAIYNDQATGTLSLERVRRALDPKKKVGGDILEVFDYLCDDPRKARPTIQLFRYAQSKVRNFTSEHKRYGTSLASVDVKWLEAFDKWMASDGLKTNTRRQIVNELKRCFNEAITQDLTTNYPFRKFSIRPEQTRKRALPLSLIRNLLYGKCSNINRKYQDYAKLIFYLRGINIKDLVFLEYDNCLNGYVEYRRAKTGRLYSIKMEPEIQEIIEKYHEEGSKYVLPIADTGQRYDIFCRVFNQGLRAIMKTANPASRLRVSSYWLRHSWASIASALDIPKEIISEGLGHSLGSSITSIYIDFDQSKVDRANRKIMNAVLGKEIAPPSQAGLDEKEM